MALIESLFDEGSFVHSNFKPNYNWTPSAVKINGTSYWFANVEGLILYSDLTDDEMQTAIAGATLGTLANVYRKQSRRSKGGGKADPLQPVHAKIGVVTNCNYCATYVNSLVFLTSVAIMNKAMTRGFAQ